MSVSITFQKKCFILNLICAISFLKMYSFTLSEALQKKTETSLYRGILIGYGNKLRHRIEY